MIKLKHIMLLGVGLALGTSTLKAQTTVTFTHAGTMSDAMVGNGGVETQNFGSQTEFYVYHQLNQQIPMVFRSFIQYDISSIPQNAIVTAATLRFYPKTVNNAASHPIYIERVAGTTWNESTITWNNQPAVITADKLAFSHSQTTNTSLQEFDVKNHVQKMVSNPASNNGWRIRLQTEQGTTAFGLVYNSSEATNTATRPVLQITYVLPIEMETAVTHCTAGNEDGALSVLLTGGSTYDIGDMFFYQTVRNLSQPGTATLTNVKTTYNVQYNSSTGEITAEDLEPGIYVLRILDDAYYASSDPRLAFYKHILVGREGETTSGILLPNYQYQENTTIAKDKPANTAPLDRANTNYHSNSSSIPLRVSDSPNTYEQAGLIKYNLDFDDQLEFTKADLHIKAWSSFFRHNNSSNAATYSLITENWEESVVTWNTRPTTNPAIAVTVPTTTYIGYDPVHNCDTVSLMPFVEYWQANPTQNYGIEMALTTYGASQLALRDYKSAANNANFVEFEFTVKNPVSASYNEDTERGTITVNAPSGHPLPYKYLISYSPLPELSALWAGIKDSVPVDSATFFAGDQAATSFTFEGLDAEHYYVGVYDNNGTKILDGNAIVSPPIELSDNDNIDVVDGVLSRGNNGNSGSAIIDGMLQPTDNGGFEFELTELGGNMVFGFNDFTHAKPTTTAEFEYSFELFADNSFDVLKSGTILFEGTAALGDVFRMAKVNNEIVFYQNRYELHRTPIFAEERAVLTGSFLGFSSTGSLSNGIKIGGFKGRPQPLTTIPFNLECGDQVGSVRTAISSPIYYGGTGTYIIKDAITGITFASGDIADLYLGIILPVGEYKIEYSYMVDLIGYVFSDYFSIGHPIFWTILNPNFVAIDGTVNTIEAYGTVDDAVAISQNGLKSSEEGWVYFHANLIKYYVPLGDPEPVSPSKMRLKMVNPEFETQAQVNVFNYGGDILNKFIWMAGDPGSMFTTYSDGIIKIRRRDTDPSPAIDWQYEALFGDDPVPFSTLDEPPLAEDQTFHALALGSNARVYDSYTSFCGFESIRSYADLTKKLDGGYYLAQNGIVKFIYNEEYKDMDDQLTYAIYDAANEVVVSEGIIEQDVVFGDNRYDLNFSVFNDETVLENGVYVLEVTNEKSEKWYLRFKIINN